MWTLLLLTIVLESPAQTRVGDYGCVEMEWTRALMCKWGLNARYEHGMRAICGMRALLLQLSIWNQPDVLKLPPFQEVVDYEKCEMYSGDNDNKEMQEITENC